MEILDYYQTAGKRPVKVICDDFNTYVAKHTNGTGTKTLFYEYIASEFLKIWEVPTPEPAFIKVLPEHRQSCIENGLQPYFFENTCLVVNM